MSSNKNKISALLTEANNARRDGRFEEAKQEIVTALNMARQLTDPNTDLIAKSFNDLARIERDLGNTSSSITTYEQLVSLHEENADQLGLAHALRHLGDIHREERNVEKADSYYLNAISIYKEHKHTSSLAFANTLRGYALLKEQQVLLEESVSLWKEARILYEQNHLQSGVEECDNQIKKLG